MKKILVAALVLSSAASYADTSSSEGFYVGAGVSGVRNDWDDKKWSPVELFGGYKLNPFVGGEVRVGASVGGGDSKITNYESVYYRTESANSVGKAYLLLGYTHAEIEAATGDFDFNGFSYGAGVGFVISEKFNLNLEYKVLANAKGTWYPDKSTRFDDLDIKLSSISATVDYRF
jgi:opacity protein-like surface antigen